MTILRELVARLGFDVDGTGFRRAESAVARVRGSLQELAVVAGTIGVGAAIKQVVELASDAQETGNVLREVFGPQGAADVESWSRRIGDEVGRSRFELQEFAGQLGAMLEPMLGSASAAQDLSTGLAHLAVDLASFFNTSDKEALIALRAGIAGESEPLRRYGIVLLDATLQEFAHAQGIRKKVSEMKVAEKTLLRYEFILAHTGKAQGDAARTSDSYANSVKALRASLKDIGTEIGASVLPKIEKVIRSARDGLASFKEWTSTTKLLETSMASVAAVALIAGAVMLAPWAPLLVTFGALVVLVEDLNVLFSDGRSLAGKYLDKAFGIGTAAALVETHRAGVDDLPRAWSSAVEAVKEYWTSLQSFDEDLADVNAIARLEMIDQIRTALNQLAVDAVKAYDELRGVFGFEASGIKAPQLEVGAEAKTARDALERKRAARKGKDADREANRIAEREARKLGLTPTTAATTASGELVADGRGIDANAKAVEYGRAGARDVRRQADLYGMPASATAPVVTAPAPSAKTPDAPANVSVGGTVINVQGWDERKIRQVIADAMDRERRKTAAALAGG